MRRICRLGRVVYPRSTFVIVNIRLLICSVEFRAKTSLLQRRQARRGSAQSFSGSLTRQWHLQIILLLFALSVPQCRFLMEETYLLIGVICEICGLLLLLSFAASARQRTPT